MARRPIKRGLVATTDFDEVVEGGRVVQRQARSRRADDAPVALIASGPLTGERSLGENNGGGGDWWTGPRWG